MTANYHANARMASVVRRVAERIERMGIGRSTKSIAQITTEYADEITNTAFAVLNGTSGKGDLSRALRALIRRLAREVFVEGLREGGIKDAESEIDSDDEATISAWIESQLPHVGDFAAWVVDLENNEANRAALRARVEMWVGSLESLGNQGIMSAKANQSVTWRLGETEEHCATCNKLNGTRRRMKWFTSKGYVPQENGSDTLDCGGWKCLCELVDDDGKVVVP